MRLPSRAVLAVLRSASLLVGTAGVVSASPRHDSAQVDRFREIIDKPRGRTAEAEQDAWLGKVDGLKITAAENKLAALERQTNLLRALLPVLRLARHGGPTW